MDRFTRRVFLSELKQQCEFAVNAYNTVLALEASRDSATLFYHLQGFLVSSANVSKILFPGSVRGTKAFKDECDQRGDELRLLLGVDDDSVLKSRELRNYFEHFDEYIQKWSNLPGRKNFVDRQVSIGAPLTQAILMTGAASGPVEDVFRTYESPPPKAGFWGQVFELHPVAVALGDLHRKIVEVQEAELAARLQANTPSPPTPPSQSN